MGEGPNGQQIVFYTGHCHITGLVKGGVNSGHLTPQTQRSLPAGVLNLFGSCTYLLFTLT